MPQYPPTNHKTETLYSTVLHGTMANPFFWLFDSYYHFTRKKRAESNKRASASTKTPRRFFVK